MKGIIQSTEIIYTEAEVLALIDYVGFLCKRDLTNLLIDPVAPMLMVLILLIGNNKKIIGEHTNSLFSNMDYYSSYRCYWFILLVTLDH